MQELVNLAENDFGGRPKPILLVCGGIIVFAPPHLDFLHINRKFLQRINAPNGVVRDGRGVVEHELGETRPRLFDDRGDFTNVCLPVTDKSFDKIGHDL